MPLWSQQSNFVFSSCPLSIKGHLHHARNSELGFVLANTKAIVSLVLDVRLEVAVCHIKALGTNVEWLRQSVADCATCWHFNHLVTLLHFPYLWKCVYSFWHGYWATYSLESSPNSSPSDEYLPLWCKLDQPRPSVGGSWVHHCTYWSDLHMTGLPDPPFEAAPKWIHKAKWIANCDHQEHSSSQRGGLEAPHLSNPRVTCSR